MDLTATTIPKSDQLNAEDLMLSGPVTVTVESVSRGNAEQPVDIHLVEFPGRAYRPSKTMRRVLIKAWGKESDAYTGHQMTLYHDPEVKFGGQKVGGIKVSHVSHITKRLDLPLTETRGKRVVHVVQPLTDTAPSRPARAPAASKPTPEQKQEIGDGFKHALITDATDKARFLNETLGRELAGWDALTADDAAQVIDALKAITAEQVTS